MGKQISTIKKIIALLTLRYFNVSPHRKRVFRSTTLLLLVLILFQVFKSLIFPPLPLSTAIAAVAILTVTANILFNIIRMFIVSSHRTRRGISRDERDNFTVGMNAVVNSATVAAGVISFFWVFGIPVQAFLSSIALFAVALVLIFQDFIKNFLFGLGMMFSSDYEIGDYVQVGDMPKGVITIITFSNIQIKSESGALLFIPNQVVRNHQVVNFSKLKPKHISVEFNLLREKVTTVTAVESAILKLIKQSFPDLLEGDTPALSVIAASKDEITFHLELPSKRASLKLKETVNRAVQRFAVEC
jgi:small-conductance mechanosensitive channel